MAKVYLDSLLQREDFDLDETLNTGKKKETFSISDLREDDFFYLTLRKPDFQRETNEWTESKVCELIKSFINGELIPAVILWRSKAGHNFVIDGSHRISSLIAWINDDYGDGTISKLAFDGLIPDEQLEIASRTRKLVDNEIGSYSDFQLSLKYPEKVKDEIVQKAKSLGALAIQLQWVEGDAKVAEDSFFKINQQAAKIDPTELKLIESRKKPNGIASRAIIKGGRGHQYWSKCTKENREEIVKLSEEINRVFFLPKLKNPVKTLDLPIGGKGYSAQSALLIFEFVNLVNKNYPNLEKDDLDGSYTVEVLRKCRKIAYLINANHASSLGLHPAVYFYSKTGRHKTASFFAITDFIIELDEKKKLKDFTKVRASFEEILISYDFIIQQITRYYRESTKALPHIKEFLMSVMNELLIENDSDEAVKKVLKKDDFKFVKTNDNDDDLVLRKDFSSETKSAVFITEALETALRCKICDARVHTNAISFDHITRKEDGGLGQADNAQLTHPYCNTTFKN